MRYCLARSIAAAMFFAAAPLLFAAEEMSLITPGGKIYVVRAGTGAELGVVGNYANPDDNVIEWSSLAQDGSRAVGLIPGIATSAAKHDLDLAYDDQNDLLIALWTDEYSLLNIPRLGILRGTQWQVSELLPSVGFPRALNPRMLLSHPVVHTIDVDGNDVWTTRSLLSVVWWEDSNVSQARYAPVFLGEDSNAGEVQVYDLPAAIGGGGPTPAATDIPAGAYLFPSLQLEGPGGGILATFADLASRHHYVVRITFPTELGQPGASNPTWLRRRLPIYGAANEAPIPRMAPSDRTKIVSSIVGASYRPTLMWRDGETVRFTRYDGRKWSDVNSIGLDNVMTYDRALRMVQDMATKN